MSIFSDITNKIKNTFHSNNDPFVKYNKYYLNILCPYCETKLEKLPISKKKCPNCNNTIYVRSNPYNSNKLLVTNDLVDEIKNIKEKISKDNWVQSICSSHSITQGNFKVKKRKLEKNLAKSLDDYDILWSLLNDKSLEYAHKNCWGVYSTTIMHMADLLYREKNLEQSLEFYLHACYLDINGPMNIENFDKRYSPFKTKNGFVAVHHLKRICKIMDLLKIDIDTVKQIFLEYNAKNKNSLVPLTPEKAWNRLNKELKFYI